MTTLAYQPPANERLLWGCVVASLLLHALLMWRMHGVEPAAPMVQEFKATIRPQAPPAPRPAVEPPKPEAIVPEPPKPEPPKPPESLPKPVVPPVTPLAPSKAPPVERKAAPVAPATPQPATPPPAAAAAAPSAPTDSKSDAKATPPATPATSAAPAAASGDLKAVIRSYELQLAQAADKFKRYPSEAMQQGWEGTARIKVHIGKDGRISGVELVSSSGHDLLDEQAKNTTNKAKPFVQIPAELRGQEFDAEIRVVFGLKQ
ncbi:MAG: hypothetical protein JWN73_4214 [Betaproteobacteria bacterium]|nr:hypothetical protein [Betaproteobacteria bacterium]